ncbi:hypothetical protein BpHYR1_011806 [Brachionus plicatilis]|uniref:Uncharacterized protein n=1 Tax=Brachionus plicatilis TaxID=10195 RepID=A0A3M7PPM4_BRAPC|nr:hypothetical protein BpHYR1_011806 [Brachionus plicatilis]
MFVLNIFKYRSTKCEIHSKRIHIQRSLGQDSIIFREIFNAYLRYCSSTIILKSVIRFTHFCVAINHYTKLNTAINQIKTEVYFGLLYLLIFQTETVQKCFTNISTLRFGYIREFHKFKQLKYKKKHFFEQKIT